MAVQIGSPAPKFPEKTEAYLRSKDKFMEVSLSDYKGKWVCLYFYPMDFTFVCPTEIVAFDRALSEFQNRGCELLGASIDSKFVHRGWCEANRELSGLKHPLLSDITKRIAMDYGVLLPEKGVALRGTFLIDPEGNIRWINVNDLPVGRSIEEVLRVLDALQTGELTGCNWHKGEAVLKV